MISDVPSVTPTAHSDVLAALRAASSKTGLDFDFLLHTAMRESSLNTQAKSKTSSATGLFQFVDQTWLGLVKRFGERYGLGSYANSIQQGSDGHYAVASAQTKSAILALRQDPQVAALMACEGAKQTKQSLECALGREVCGGELYAAHFLGPAGARHLIELKERNPNAPADAAFPQAAKANKSVFYHADGTSKTVGELYAWAVNPSDGQTPAAVQAIPAQTQPTIVAPNSSAVDVSSLFASFAEPERMHVTAAVPPDQSTPSELRRSDAYFGSTPLSTVPSVPQIIPQSPALLSPGLVQMLAALSPAALRRAG